MNCVTARQTLELACPDVVEPQGLDEAARHVEACPACQMVVHRQDEIDAEIGSVCRDVPLPVGLKERLLAGIVAAETPVRESAEGSHPGSAAEAPPVVMPTGKSIPRPTRRRWLRVASAAAAIALVAGSAVWFFLPRATVDLEKVAQRLTEKIDPDELAPFTQFGNGLAPEPPASMVIPRTLGSALRLPGAEFDAQADIAVYVFKVSGPGRVVSRGRLAVVPKAYVINVPRETRFGAPNYRGGFVTSTWVEGRFAYVCCLEGASLEGLRAVNPAI